jgi:tryptophanyl-tRNA synthetase
MRLLLLKTLYQIIKTIISHGVNPKTTMIYTQLINQNFPDPIHLINKVMNDL